MNSLTAHKISFICFLDLFAASLIVPLMNNYLRREIFLSNFSIGVISSTFSLLQIVSAPTVGYLSDLYGRKNILLSCLLVCVVSYFLLGVFKNVFVIVLVRVLLGLCKHTQVLCKAYISDICTNSTKAYSQLMTVTFLGFFIGPALGGHIITYENGFLYICCITSAVFLVNLVYSYFVVNDVERKRNVSRGSEGLQDAEVNPLLEEELGGMGTKDGYNAGNSEKPFEKRLESKSGSQEKRRKSSQGPKGFGDSDVNYFLEEESSGVDTEDGCNIENPLEKRLESKPGLASYCKETFNIDWSRYWDIFLIKFLYSLSMSLFYSNYISVVTHSFGASSQMTGYTVSFQGLVGSFSNMFIHVRNKNSHSSLLLSFSVLAASVLCLYLCVNLYLFVFLLIPLSISSSLIRVLSLNMTMCLSETHRHGNISGIYNSLTSIAKVVTPLLGGLVSDWAQDNYKVAFLVSFLFALLGVLVSWITMRSEETDGRDKKEN